MKINVLQTIFWLTSDPESASCLDLGLNHFFRCHTLKSPSVASAMAGFFILGRQAYWDARPGISW